MNPKKLIAFVISVFCISIISCNSKKEESTEKEIYNANIINQSTLIISDSNNRQIFKFNWDEAKSQYKNADTIYELGWNSDYSKYWFWSVVPCKIIYIACYDVTSDKLNLFNPPDDGIFYTDYCFDFEKGIFFYSDAFSLQDAVDLEIFKNTVFYLKSYYVFTKQEKTIDSQQGRKFSPRIENNELIYVKDNKTLSFKYK